MVVFVFDESNFFQKKLKKLKYPNCLPIKSL